MVLYDLLPRLLFIISIDLWGFSPLSTPSAPNFFKKENEYVKSGLIMSISANFAKLFSSRSCQLDWPKIGILRVSSIA